MCQRHRARKASCTGPAAAVQPGHPRLDLMNGSGNDRKHEAQRPGLDDGSRDIRVESEPIAPAQKMSSGTWTAKINNGESYLTRHKPRSCIAAAAMGVWDGLCVALPPRRDVVGRVSLPGCSGVAEPAPNAFVSAQDGEFLCRNEQGGVGSSSLLSSVRRSHFQWPQWSRQPPWTERDVTSTRDCRNSVLRAFAVVGTNPRSQVQLPKACAPKETTTKLNQK